MKRVAPSTSTTDPSKRLRRSVGRTEQAALFTSTAESSKRLKVMTGKMMEPSEVRKTRIEDLPTELQTEIFARVAKHSITDLFNAKLSCKLFHEIGEDPHVCRNANLLEKTKILPKWFPEWWIQENNSRLQNPELELQQQRQRQEDTFLRKCNGNPEIFIRRAIWNFFGQSRPNFELAIDSLETLLKEANLEAIYTKCIIQIFSSRNHEHENGLELLYELKKSEVTRNMIKQYRARIVTYIKLLSLRHWVSPDSEPPYCPRRHSRVNPWVFFDEADELVGCEGCSRIDIDIHVVKSAIHSC